MKENAMLEQEFQHIPPIKSVGDDELTEKATKFDNAKGLQEPNYLLITRKIEQIEKTVYELAKFINKIAPTEQRQDLQEKRARIAPPASLGDFLKSAEKRLQTINAQLELYIERLKQILL